MTNKSTQKEQTSTKAVPHLDEQHTTLVKFWNLKIYCSIHWKTGVSSLCSFTCEVLFTSQLSAVFDDTVTISYHTMWQKPYSHGTRITCGPPSFPKYPRKKIRGIYTFQIISRVDSHRHGNYKDSHLNFYLRCQKGKFNSVDDISRYWKTKSE